jgi:hypothetical protein
MPAPVIPPALSCRDAEKPTQACAAQGNPTGALQPHSRPCHRRARRRRCRPRRRHLRQDVSGPGGRAAGMTGPPRLARLERTPARRARAPGSPCDRTLLRLLRVSACGSISISRSEFVAVISAPAAVVVHGTASLVGSCAQDQPPDGSPCAHRLRGQASRSRIASAPRPGARFEEARRLDVNRARDTSDEVTSGSRRICSGSASRRGS